MAIIFLVLVLILFAWPALVAKENAKLDRCSLAITAEVVAHKRDVMSEGLDYNPVIQYTYQDKVWERSVNRRLGEKEIEAQYPIGKNITVYIDPEKPGNCSENPKMDQNSNWFAVSLCLILLIILLCLK